MKSVGIIGFGSMGSMLAKGFLTRAGIDPSSLMIASRRKETFERVLQLCPSVQTGTSADVAHFSDIIFVCVKPSDIHSVLCDITKDIRPKTHIVSIAACVKIQELISVIPENVSKVIPSLTSVVGEGISLVCHHTSVSIENQRFLENLLGSLSTVKTIAESAFEIAADLTSCAPGLIAAIFNQYIEAAVRTGEVSRLEAEEMLITTLSGTAKLLLSEKMTFSETIHRVATKGGITEEGIRVLDSKLPVVFDEMLSATLAKHVAVHDHIKKQYYS